MNISKALPVYDFEMCVIVRVRDCPPLYLPLFFNLRARGNYLCWRRVKSKGDAFTQPPFFSGGGSRLTPLVTCMKCTGVAANYGHRTALASYREGMPTSLGPP